MICAERFAACRGVTLDDARDDKLSFQTIRRLVGAFARLVAFTLKASHLKFNTQMLVKTIDAFSVELASWRDPDGPGDAPYNIDV